MKHLLIANKGLLEIEALTLLGASSKRGDKTKIGKFGSGNKYALAYFLRNGCKVRIFSGNEEIKLGLIRKSFREKPFDVITVNGAETSITTEFGHEWSMWQAIRELYTNAMDEGLLYFGFTEIPIEEDVAKYIADNSDETLSTRIYIEATPEVEDFMFNIQDYIAIGNEVLFECKYGKIYRKHNNTTCIYYKGIRCYETNKESIYDYDFNNVNLDENRLISYSWELPENMWKLLFECDKPVVVRTLLTSVQQTKFIENSIDGDFVTLPANMNEAVWRESVDGNTIVPRDLGGYVKDEDRPKTLFLPAKLYTAMIGVIGKDIKNKEFTISTKGGLYHKVEPDILMNEILHDVVYFFSECGFKIPYPVIVVDFDNKVQLGGITEDNEILIGITAMSRGKQYVANTMIEEFIHIKYGVADKSRGFQDAIIDEFLTYMKLKNAFSL